MKRLLLIWAALAALSQAGELPVQTDVLNYRRSYRIPTIEGTSRMTLTLGFTPPPGYVVREQAEFNGQIKGTDATGKSIVCTPSELNAGRADTGSATLELALAPHPKGEWLRLQGQAKLTLASGIKRHPRHKISLTAASEFTTGGICFTATPAAANTSKTNIEKGRMHVAELTLSYPDTHTILHVFRIWQNATTPDSPVYRQELQADSEISKNGKKNLLITLWDAFPEESIEIVTCARSRRTEVPIDLYLNLSGAMPPPTAAKKK